MRRLTRLLLVLLRNKTILLNIAGLVAGLLIRWQRKRRLYLLLSIQMLCIGTIRSWLHVRMAPSHVRLNRHRRWTSLSSELLRTVKLIHRYALSWILGWHAWRTLPRKGSKALCRGRSHIMAIALIVLAAATTAATREVSVAHVAVL